MRRRCVTGSASTTLPASACAKCSTTGSCACAGWITPEVVRDLDMDLRSYPHRLLTFPRLRVHFGRLHVPVPCVQHSIRRFEFDAWLLERSGAPLEQHNVRRIARDGNGFVIDDAFRCRWLIGAGGTRWPVYRTPFRRLKPRAAEW